MVKPQPSGFINTKIYFINDSTGYLMNYNGELFITRDTGDTWQLLKNFPTAKTFQIQDSAGVIPVYDGCPGHYRIRECFVFFRYIGQSVVF